MAAFSAVNKAPGVYIEEVLVPGPIPGVATSVAAFIGPARVGPINTPTRVTNWTEFVTTFGVSQDPYIWTPPVFAAHAVRGFFDNGGADCFFVRVAAAKRGSLVLNDRAATPQPALVVTAKEEGPGGNAITIEVKDDSLVAGVAAARADAPLTSAKDNQAVLAAADAEKFFVGDVVLLTEAGKTDRAAVTARDAGKLTFAANLANQYGGGTIRIADLAAGQQKIRLADVTGLEAGSVVSITQGATTETAAIAVVEREAKFVGLAQGLTNAYTMAAADAAVNMQSLEFSLHVVAPGKAPENFGGLSMDPRHSRSVARVVTSALVDVAPGGGTTAPPENRPAVVAATPLAGGTADNVAALGAPHYTAALTALEKVDEVTIVCIPDRSDAEVQLAMIAHCEKLQDRFPILDPPANFAPKDITAHRNLLASDRGYGALYYPRIYISNPAGGDPLMIPPSGHVAGVYARTDDEKGVHKAPANEAVRGVLRLERTLSDDQQGPLNEQGVNVIRSFVDRGRGIRIWGARTIAKETQWRYVNVRRLLLFIEESIQEGTEFAVFEPNNQELWQKLKRQVSEFLDRVWRSGALLGAKPEEAYRVRIDDELNPPSTIALGQLVIEVRVAPTTPAEFVVFQIIQEPGRKIVNE